MKRPLPKNGRIYIFICLIESSVKIAIFVSGEPYNITIQAVDHGKPPRSATAVIQLSLRPRLQPEEGLQELPRSTIERVSKKKTLIINNYESPATNHANELETKQLSPKLEPQSQLENNPGVKETDTESPTPTHLLPVGQMFKKEVYSLDLYENVQTPLVILDLGKEVVGLGKESPPIHYRIVGSNYGLFSVEETGGQLYLTQSPDREQREKYILRVKVSNGPYAHKQIG